MDGLPIKNGDFSWQTVSHNQMVQWLLMGYIWDILGRWVNPLVMSK